MRPPTTFSCVSTSAPLPQSVSGRIPGHEPGELGVLKSDIRRRYFTIPDFFFPFECAFTRCIEALNRTNLKLLFVE